MDIPNRWSTWIHNKTGNDYLVMCVTNIHATRGGWPVTVVYKDNQEGCVWSRPLSEWVDKYHKG